MNAPKRQLPGSLAAHPRIDQWLDFSTEGSVRLRSGKVEIGQGIATALVQIAADELDVAPERITLVAGDTRESPDEGFTAGSMSISVGGSSIRLAAAAARRLLLEEAAKLTQSSVTDLVVRDGAILVGERETDLSYWSLAGKVDLKQEAADFAEPKPKGALKLIGTSLPRTDLPAKVTGGGAFIQDLEFDGMLHGRVLHPPLPSARIASFDDSALKGDPDVLQLVRDGAFIGVMAEREDAAIRAFVKLQQAVEWSAGEEAPDDISAHLQAADAEDELSQETGEPRDVEGRQVTTTISRPYIAHASIGTSCAIALWQDGKLTCHSHTQGAYQLREGLAPALDMAIEDIQVIHVPGAGCYGHNGADDAVLDAALLARAVPGRPVRLVWSRMSELRNSPYGSAMVVTATATLGDDGRIKAWTTDSISQSHGNRPGRGGSPNLLAAEYMDKPTPSTWRKDVPLQFGGGADRNAYPPYAIPNIRTVKHIVHDVAYRASSLRGLGAQANVFAVETLMDDVAAEAGVDPLQFRLDHLDDERASAVLRRAAEMAGWPGKEEEGAGLGLAYARYKNTAAFCAVVVRVALDEDIRLTHAWSAADAGEIINPDGLKNQIEGGIIQSASWTLKEQILLQGGVPQSVDWETYPILTFPEAPEIEIDLIAPEGAPTLGVGECAQGPTAAAIGNAIFRALGVRVRDMPLTREKIIAAVG